MELKTSLNKVIRKYSKIFSYKKIKITLEDIDEVVYSDAKWLDSILEQIISNALKYTAEDTGEIKIYTKTIVILYSYLLKIMEWYFLKRY